MKKHGSKTFILAAISFSILFFFLLDGQQYLSLQFVKANLGLLKDYVAANTLLSAVTYVGIYVIAAALSLPGAAVLTLTGGALFGIYLGTGLVSLASTTGACLAFLASRFLFQESIQNKFGGQLKSINQGLKKDGATYLLTLRLVPAFPFFLVNLVMGLTQIPLNKFFLYSLIGMLPGTFVYVNAGEKLSELESLKGILSFDVIFAFAVLGLFPFFTKPILSYFKNRKIYAPFKRPKSYEYNIVVIGAGSAGLVTSYIGAATKSKVALIEKHKMGGDCLNTGCVPSKALIRSARFVRESKIAAKYGIRSSELNFDFAEVMERVQTVIKKIEPHDSVDRYSSLGVECISGTAKIINPFQVEVNGRILTTKNIVIATGARPRMPSIPGLVEGEFFTSDTIWNLRKQPRHLVVIGGGPIGCELAQAFRSLGSRVTILDAAPRIFLREDMQVSELMAEVFAKEGIDVLNGISIENFSTGPEGRFVRIKQDGKERDISFDEVLVAVGRQANVTGFGAEELGLELTPQGTFAVDEYLRTKYPNIYACGDVVGPYQFTHAAAHQAWFASVNALFAPFKKFKIDYRVLPWATFTSPEVARVGLSEAEAQKDGIDYETTIYHLDDLDRAIADSAEEGFVKVLTPRGSDKILGVTIVADHASDMLPEFVTAMKYGLGLNKILGTIHSYPTMTEANKYVAGVWRRAHAPELALKFLKWYHSWRKA